MPYRSVFRPGLFSGQTIIVTGGGSGIGRCTAHELASLGAKVIVTGRKQAKLDAVVAEITEDGGSAAGYVFDIRDEDAVKTSIRRILDEHGAVSGLVNNAGGQYPMPLASISKKGWDAVVANNLTGGFLVAREVYNQCMKQHGGAIVNMIADMWGGMPGMGHSGAARAGMLNFTETAAIEWAVSGVRVNAVAPGYVASSGMDHYDPSFAHEVIPKLVSLAPLKRLAEEAEVSAAIVFLLSEAAAFITGACIKIDGGTSLGIGPFPLLEHRRSKPYRGFHRAVVPQAVRKIQGE
ncbi:citronellol/citronellal dehydrogenase [Fontimonas thermophila]|uniref:Peroxisomal trans-2-enoyl-CoA reductase n=1 Tax=Fontimonas thermophila TaxID=1076937 RepID=A0A1I2IYG7_9GAMM|nr:SDR family oxidoreductase [Fontimonas thermophila]SFF45716.1 citronellol/citronellal dehydrogenase [Fontimonas thermophila]